MNILLIGAGHTHALALQSIAKAAQRCNASVTLVSGDSQMPYSGMLPGVVSGLYKKSEMVLDVAALARKNGVEYIDQDIIGIDPRLRQVRLASEDKLDYDIVSLNTGGDCKGVVQEEGGDVMPVKPVFPFLDWLENWSDNASATCAVVGGGVAGCEIALSIDARLRSAGRVGGVYLVGRNPELVPGRPAMARRVHKLMVKRSISQILGQEAVAAVPGTLVLSDGTEHYADHVVVCSGVGVWSGLAESGLECDSRGCVVVNHWLQSVSHPDVFACGDCASFSGASDEIPKSGVYAVRQARTLAANLAARMSDAAMQPWSTTGKALAIISSGDGKAIAHRHGLVAQGRLVWLWKDYLDTRFMRKFSSRGRSPASPS